MVFLQKSFVSMPVIVLMIQATLIPIPQSNVQEQTFSKILTKITACSSTLMHLVLLNQCEDLDDLTVSYPHNKINKPGAHPANLKPHFYALCLNDSSDANIANLLENLHKNSRFNPRATFLIYVRKYTETIFRIAQEFYVKSLVVVDELFDVRTYKHQFSNGKRVGVFLGNLRTYSCELLKIPEPLWNETTLTVALLKLPPYVICKDCEVKGVEMDALEFVQSVLGFKIDYVEENFQNWGRKYENGRYDNVYGLIRRKEASLGVGMFQLDIANMHDFDMTYPYMFDNLVWVVPRIEAVRNVKIVQKSAAILIISAGSVISLVWWLESRLILRNSYYSDLSNVVLAIVRLLNAGTLNNIPTRSRARFIYFLWLFATWIVNLQIQSYLMYFLTYDPRSVLVDSYQQLINSNMNIGLYNNEDWRVQVAQEAKGHKIFCNIDDYCLNRTIVHKDLAVVKPYRMVVYEIVSKYLDEAGNAQVHVIDKEPILLRHINMCFAKGHPIFEEFEEILKWVVNCGFIEYWLRWYDNYVNVLYNKNVRDKLRFRSNALDFYNLSLVFYILLSGYAIATGCFFLEILVHHYKYGT